MKSAPTDTSALAVRLETAVNRLRREQRRFDSGQAADLEAALEELEAAIAGFADDGTNLDGELRRLMTNALCELEEVKRSLSEQLESTAERLRATQGQRRGISAYAKAYRA